MPYFSKQDFEFGGYTLNAPGMPNVTLDINRTDCTITLRVAGAASADDLRKLIGAASAMVIDDNLRYTTEEATQAALGMWYMHRTLFICGNKSCGVTCRLSQTCFLGDIGPLCPKCRDTGETSNALVASWKPSPVPSHGSSPYRAEEP